MMREVETLHLKFLKPVLCVLKNTFNDIVYGETGSYCLYIDVKDKLLGYWIATMTRRREKLAYVLYQCLLYLDLSRLYTSPWLKEVKCILNTCGMSGVLLQQEVTNPVWLRKAVEQRLRDQRITQRFSNFNLESVCTAYEYVAFKNCYGTEEYLTKLKTKTRTELTKLRTNNNRIPLITERYQNVPREERLCDERDPGAMVMSIMSF